MQFCQAPVPRSCELDLRIRSSVPSLSVLGSHFSQDEMKCRVSVMEIAMYGADGPSSRWTCFVLSQAVPSSRQEAHIRKGAVLILSVA